MLRVLVPRRAERREVIDQAPVVSFPLWTFKGTIWHPKQAINGRQLTPVATSRQQVDGPTWGTGDVGDDLLEGPAACALHC